MKKSLYKKGLVLGIIILFVGASIIPSTIGTISKKTTLPNSTSSGYIQDLIDNASDGDTIYIPSGIYYERIIINKSISLIGEDKDTTIIDSQQSGYIVSVSADRINLSGFTICNGVSYGIRIHSNNNTISDNNILNNEYGICLWGENNTLMNNHISSNNRYGIDLLGESNTIAVNIISSNNDYGIKLDGYDDNTITENSFFIDGLWVYDSYHNTVENNMVNGRPLVYLEDESDEIISDAGQVILLNCNRITLENLNLSYADVGVQLWGTNNCIISNCNCSNNYYGIYLYRSTLNIITGNTIRNKDEYGHYGIYLSNSDNNNITGNNISKNNNGICFDDSSRNTIRHNNLANNGYGLNLLYPSSYNILLENKIINCGGKGVNLDGSYRNNISDNTISNSGDDCIYLEHAISNTISNNTISDSGRDGIGLLFSSKNNIIYGNNINSNEECGIHLWHSSNRNNITGNIISSNNEDGIEILASDYNTISDNEISNNGYGINLHCNFMGDDFSNYNYIRGNTINSNKRDGIYLHNRETSIDNNIITRNVFSSNNRKSINFSCSGDNIISKNNFLGFKSRVFFKECENTWEQNYWYRPRILPKLIFGTKTIGYKTLPWINIDWLPALRPYKIEG